MKIRIDFVTNSSSSSFVACGVLSRELSEFICTLSKGKTSCYSNYAVGGIEIDDDIVSVVTTLEVRDFFYLYEIDEDEERSAKEEAADNACAGKPANVADILSTFLPRLTSEEHKKLMALLEDAAGQGNIVARTYMDEEDGFDWPHYNSRDFVHSKDLPNETRSKKASNKKMSVIDLWYSIYEPYFDYPDVLPKIGVTYAVYADKGVTIDMSAYGWTLHKAFTKKLQYLIVDTDHIPNLDRFDNKQRAIASGDTQKATNLGTTILDKVIEAKKAGHPIQIISRDYLEGCIATDSFV